MNAFPSPPRRQRHFGAYGICVSDAHVLLVRKSRGPYTGLLDLPGGGIEFGEEPEAALRREFNEEAGLCVVSAMLMTVESNLVAYRAADDVDEELHHIGLIYRVEIARDENSIPTPKSDPDGEDSDGAAWFLTSDLVPSALTSFAYSAVRAIDSGVAAQRSRDRAGQL